MAERAGPGAGVEGRLGRGGGAKGVAAAELQARQSLPRLRLARPVPGCAESVERPLVGVPRLLEPPDRLERRRQIAGGLGRHDLIAARGEDGGRAFDDSDGFLAAPQPDQGHAAVVGHLGRLAIVTLALIVGLRRSETAFGGRQIAAAVGGHGLTLELGWLGGQGSRPPATFGDVIR